MKKIWYLMPEVSLKQKIRSVYSNKMTYRRNTTQLKMIADLPISESGVSQDGYGFIKLENGLTFYDYFPSEPQMYLYNKLRANIKSKLVKEAMRVAIDIVGRHINPALNGHDKEKFYIPREGDVVLELGSYIGFYTIKIAKRVGESGHIVAVEAEKENLKLLKKNIQENKLQNVSIVPKGVWSEKGTKTFYMGGNQLNSFYQDKRHIKKEIIEIDTVDNICRDLEINKVNFAIIEINGAEVEALKGMRDMLKQNVKLVISSRYMRDDGVPWYKIVTEMLTDSGFDVNNLGNGILFASRN